MKKQKATKPSNFLKKRMCTKPLEINDLTENVTPDGIMFLNGEIKDQMVDSLDIWETIDDVAMTTYIATNANEILLSANRRDISVDKEKGVICDHELDKTLEDRVKKLEMTVTAIGDVCSMMFTVLYNEGKWSKDFKTRANIRKVVDEIEEYKIRNYMTFQGMRKS